MTITNPDALALLQTILERPEDDAARLIYADWLEDHGETAHSEFIRVQIELAQRLGAAIDDAETFRHDAAAVRLLGRERELLAEGADGGRSDAWDWMGQHVEAMVPHGEPWEKHVAFRRGFVAEIRCSLAQWFSVPIPCRRCVGRGTVAGQPCSLCQGTLVNLGHGPAVCETQPLEWVEAIGMQPHAALQGGAFWFGPGIFHPSDPRSRAQVPGRFFELLAPHAELAGRNALSFPSEEEAKTALSAAMMVWARREAGLLGRLKTGD